VITFKPVALFSLLAGVILSLGALTVVADHDSDESIAERISSVGSLCIEGEKCKAPVAKAAAAPTGPRSGEDVYAGSCAACHDTGAASAPKVGDIAAWTPRIDKGLETLFSNALNGINAMPAKGMCMSCSDDEIKDAVTHMVDNSK
jgi:cytochrome c5